MTSRTKSKLVRHAGFMFLLSGSLLSCTTETATGQATEQSGDDVEAKPTMPMPATKFGKQMFNDSQRATSIAIAKAEELGYDLEKMLIEISLADNGGWNVAFRPNSKTQSGGDITVEFDSNVEITDVKRWR